jgi:hypothetical protein
MIIGLDLGDRNGCYCVLDENAEVIERETVGWESSPWKEFSSSSQPACWRWKRVAVDQPVIEGPGA